MQLQDEGRESLARQDPPRRVLNFASDSRRCCDGCVCLCALEQSVDSWLTAPLSSSFADTALRIDPYVHRWLDVGSLQSGVVHQSSAPAKMLGSGSSGADYHPQAFVEELQSEPAFTSVKISPRGVAAPGTAITAAVAVTDSRGGARVYTQNRTQSSSTAWSMRMDMGAYLLKAYFASHWQALAPFDSAVPLPSHLPSISSFAQQNRRRQLVSIEVVAWSGMVRPLGGNPFVMLALGSRAGVVSIWRIPLMVDPPAVAAPADAHPQLLCSVTPVGDAQVLISQLAFSPLYWDASRRAQVCSLAIGTSAGRVHLYGLVAAPTLPMTIHPLTSHRLGSKLMSISALSWSQLLGGPAACSQCAWCFASECTHRPVASAHGMSVHHILAVGCGGHIQVITTHPDLYAQGEAANLGAVAAAAAAAAGSAAATASAAPAVPPAHPSLCHVFCAIRAHSSSINSFVWNIQAAPPLHNVVAALDRPGADDLIPLACHHVQLLSSSNDDTVHRWVIKDRIGSRGEGALVLLDSNRRADLEVWHPEAIALAAEADPDYASRSALLQFPTQQRLHGASGLLRSSDGMLLYTHDLLVAGSDSGMERKRQMMSMLRASPFPFVDLTDDVREQCAQAALEYSSITLGEAEITNVTLDAPPVPTDSPAGAEASQRSAMDIMQEELQEERRQEAAASRTSRKERAAAATTAAAAAPAPSPSTAAGQGPVKMELDLGDSPDPRSLTTALATPSSKPKKATSKSKQKDKRKRKKFSELGAGESEEESEDEWKGGGGGDEDDEEEPSSSSESPSSEDDGGSGVEELKTPATKVKRAPRFSSGRPKKPRQGDRKFEVAANVPIPQPTQTEALFKSRLSRQLEAMWNQAVLLWRDTVQQAGRARLCSAPGPAPATALPSSLSFFSLYTFFTGLLNPLHLSIPPSLSAVATRMVTDEAQVKLLASSASSSPSWRRAPDPNPETTYSLWWAMLPHLIPSESVYGGFAQIFRDESEQGEQLSGADKSPLPLLYPIDAFALPIHRQLPFIFGADSLMYTAENCVSELFTDQTALATLWLDSPPASLTPDFASRRMQLRLALSLLQMAQSARSPYLALDISNQPRAHSLQQRLTQALHLQYLHQRMEHLTTTLRAASDDDARAQAALQLTQAQPLASVLLMADWLLQSLLSSRAWDHPNALSLLRTLHCLYAAFPLLCQAETQWLQDLGLPNEPAAAVAAASAAPAPSWHQKLSSVASSWRPTAREKCVLCASIVPLTSSDTATCESKHAMPRCRRTLLSITGMQSTDACGVCGGAIIRNAADNDSHLCPLCIANTHPTD